MMAKNSKAVIDLEESPVGERFFWNEESSGPWVEMRLPPTDVLKDIGKRHTTKKVEHVLNTATRHMDRVEYNDVDEESVSCDLWDYVFTAWGGGWVNKDGAEHVCDAETKAKFMRNAKFNAFASKCLDTLRENAAKLEAATEKN